MIDWIAHRAQSRPAKHGDIAANGCPWPLSLSFQPSARPGWEFIAVLRCARCDSEALIADHVARAVEVRGVLGWDPSMATTDDDDPWTNYGAW